MYLYVHQKDRIILSLDRANLFFVPCSVIEKKIPKITGRQKHLPLVLNWIFGTKMAQKWLISKKKSCYKKYLWYALVSRTLNIKTGFIKATLCIAVDVREKGGLCMDSPIGSPVSKLLLTERCRILTKNQKKKYGGKQLSTKST